MKSSYMKVLPLVAAVGVGGCGLDPFNQKSSDEEAAKYAQKTLGIDSKNLDCKFEAGMGDSIKCKAVQDKCKIDISCTYNKGCLNDFCMGEGECKIDDISKPADSCPAQAVTEYSKVQLEKKNHEKSSAMGKKLNEVGQKTGDIWRTCENKIDEKKEVVGMTCLMVGEKVAGVCKTGACTYENNEPSCVVTEGLPDITVGEDLLKKPLNSKEACDLDARLRQ